MFGAFRSDDFPDPEKSQTWKLQMSQNMGVFKNTGGPPKMDGL